MGRVGRVVVVSLDRRNVGFAIITGESPHPIWVLLIRPNNYRMTGERSRSAIVILAPRRLADGRTITSNPPVETMFGDIPVADGCRHRTE